jgi:hypothetical protein
MGQFISAIVTSVDDICQTIAKTATNVGSTVTQLGTVAAGFTTSTALFKSPALKHVQSLHLQASPAPSTANDAGDVPSALKSAMAGAQSATEALFKTLYSSVTAGGSDKGVDQNFNANGDVSTVATLIKQDFDNWQIAADPTTMNDIANTIKNGATFQMGASGTQHGVHNINLNQRIVWTAAYGMFSIDAASNKNGLVYAFTAGFDSGF